MRHSDNARVGRRFRLVWAAAAGFGGEDYHVIDTQDNQRNVGRIRHATERGPWRVISAGHGVTGNNTPHESAEAACEALMALRAASQAEGRLHVDETGLRRVDRDILDFETNAPVYGIGSKAAAVREQFDMTMTRYYAVLNRLLEDPAALAYSPLTVKRLLRLRDRRRAERSRDRDVPR